MKTRKFPTIIGVILLLLGITAGVLLVNNRQIFKLGASTQAAPKNVRVTNITDSSFTVTWLTEKAALGYLTWGENKTSLNKTKEDEIGKAGFTHTVTIGGINPEEDYFFAINSDGSEYDNNGAVWQTQTAPTLPTPDTSILASGNVITITGSPAQDALVIFIIGGSSPLSTTTSKSGTWLIPLSAARSQDLANNVDIDPKNTLIEISVQASLNETATAQVYAEASNPTPPIKLGQNFDFKSLAASQSGQSPTSSVDLPAGAERISKFDIPDDLSTPSPDTVTLESHTNGEIISTFSPEFFGGGPPGTTITITVESDHQSEQVVVSNGGSWTWSPPSNLAEGAHKITISWRDSVGTLRTLIRTFIVQAAEIPSFESTPSASPTTTPTASPSSSPSPTISPTPSASASPLPDAGSLTPTLVLSIMGMGFITFGFLVWKFEKVTLTNERSK